MGQISKSIKIKAPLPKVFAYVTNPENWTRYVPSLISVKNISNDPPVKGTTFDWTYRVLGMNFRGKGTVSAYVKDRKFAIQMHGAFPITETFLFEAEGDSTRLSFEVSYELPGKVLSVVSKMPVIERVHSREAGEVIKRLKDLCEAETT
jgi:ligand-binding SRPBCC domain-containing protein